MPKYRVKIRQWVEETCTVEVEAPDPQAAVDKVLQNSDDVFDFDWEDGSDVDGPYAVEATDENDKVVWTEKFDEPAGS